MLQLQDRKMNTNFGTRHHVIPDYDCDIDQILSL